jgi:hypothetical protein
MVALLRHDAPWIWGFHPKDYSLQHAWLFNRKPSKVGNNTLKYQRIDVAMRERLRAEWNRPIRWPLALVLALLLIVAGLAWRAYRQRERQIAR